MIPALRPVAVLVATRLRRRIRSASLAVGAVAASVGLVAVIAGIGIVAGDLAVRRAFDDLPPGQRDLRLTAFRPSGLGAAPADRAVHEALTRMWGPGPDHRAAAGTQEGTVGSGVLFRRVGVAGLRYDVQVAGIDDLADWVSIEDGRLPRPCDGTACEAVLLSAAPRPEELEPELAIGGLRLRIVGRGLQRERSPLGPIDQSGPRSRADDDSYRLDTPSPAAILVVDGTAAVARAAGVDAIGRTYAWSVPVEAEAIHPWTVGDLRGRIDRTLAAIADAAIDVRLDVAATSPLGVLEAEARRAAVAGGRLLFVASLGVAILLAFAAFASLVGREEMGEEDRRLQRLGATRAQRAALLLFEAGAQGGAGAALGLIGGIAGIAVLGATRGLDPGAVVVAGLEDGGLVVAIGAVVVAAVAAIAVGLAPAIRPGAWARTAAVVVATSAIVLAWQLFAAGPLGPDDILGTLGGPVLILLPAIAAFGVAGALLVLLPPVLRRVARGADRLPLAGRLAVLAIAREPHAPAATIVLLAVSVGTIVFSLGYGATLRQGIADQAAFDTGMDIRVVEAGSVLDVTPTVVPLDRYAVLGDAVHVSPVMRLRATSPSGRPVQVLGLPPRDLPALRGWRADLAGAPIDDLATRIALPGPYRTAGQALPAGEPRLRLPVHYTGDPLRASAVVLGPRGGSARIELGTVREGDLVLAADLPAEVVGGTLIAVVFANDQLVAGEYHPGELRRAVITFGALPGLVPAEPVQLEIADVSTVVVRAPQPTDGLALPAILGPGLRDGLAPDGTLHVALGNATIRLRSIGEATAFPTVDDASTTFAVVALDPLLVAVDASLPGAGQPNEAWLRLDDPSETDVVVATLGRPPFRSPGIESRTRIAAERLADPIAGATVWALAAAAIAGLVLAFAGLALGTIADVRDERGELADLEAQGLTPAALQARIVARTTILGALGTAAGLVAGLVLVQLVTGTLALAIDATRPVPPLVIVHPWPVLGTLIGGLIGVTVAIVMALARGGFRRDSLEGRSG